MTAVILDGRATLAAIKAELRDRVRALAGRGIVPGLGTVLVGDDPASRWYVAAKHRDCAEIGVASIQRELPAGSTQAQVEAVVDELNADPACTAFLVQQPTGLDEFAILSGSIRPRTSTGCTRTTWVAGARAGRAAALHAAGHRRAAPPLRGADQRRACGRGRAAGSPSAGRWACCSPGGRENATVTLCHTGTRTCRRWSRRRTSWSLPRASPARSPPTWSSRARRCSMSG